MRKRNIQKIVRFNRKEAQDLAAKAKKACLSEAGLIRLLIRGYEPKEKPDDRFYDVAGIFIELPVGYEAQVRPRSGLATKHGITVINSPGTVDADFRGELKTSLVNLSNEPFEIVPGERIAQIVVARHERVEWEDVEVLSETARGAGGWGSTGKK